MDEVLTGMAGLIKVGCRYLVFAARASFLDFSSLCLRASLTDMPDEDGQLGDFGSFPFPQ
jgi:hypothetical protein